MFLASSGPLGGPFEGLSGRIGAILGRLAALLGRPESLLRRFEALLGASWDVFGRSRRPPGPSFAVLGQKKGKLQNPSKTKRKSTFLASSGPLGGPLGGLLGRLWGLLGRLKRLLGRLRPLEAVFGVTRGRLGPS